MAQDEAVNFPDLTRVLTRRAASIAKARAELRRRSDPARWHQPRLLWPDFTRRPE